MGDTEGALRDYSEACRLDPDRPLAFASMGRLLEQQGRYTEAVEHLDKAVALDGSEVDFYRCRAGCERAMGQWKAASDDFAKCVLDICHTLKFLRVCLCRFHDKE